MIRSMLGMISGCALLVAACGGDSDDGGKFNTSVDSGKKVNMLTATEQTQICKDLDTWGKDFEKTITPKACKIDGALKETKAECEKAVADCLKEPGEPLFDGGMCMGYTRCTATVGEIQKCINDWVQAGNTYLDRFPSCAQIADGSGSFPAGTPAEPASCKAIEKTCPDFEGIGFDSGESTDK